MLQRYALLALICSTSIHVAAEHLPGGTISTRCLGNNFHEITLQLFRDCSGSEIAAQGLELTNDCGVQFQVNDLSPVSVEEVSPLCADQLPNSTCNGGSLVGYQLYTFRTTVFLSPCDNWNIHWTICCRSPSLNVQVQPGLWIEAIVNNADGECNASPVFADSTIPLVCIGQPVSYDASALETDGDLLRYHLIDARFSAPAPTPVQYQGGYSGAEPFTGMVLDTITGGITFLPTVTGIIITVVEVSEYDADGNLLGKVMRDFPFIVSACSNTVPSTSGGVFTEVTGTAAITGERSLSICTGDVFCAPLSFFDVDDEQELTITTNAADVLPGATMEVTGTNPATAVFCWNSTGASVGTYQFTITATDNACPIEGFQQFAYSVSVGGTGSAGEDAQSAYCGEAAPFPLFDLLGGSPAPGGTWTDEGGSPFSPVFTPGIDAPGEYHYTVAGSGDCVDDAVLTLELLLPTDPECMGLGIRDHHEMTIRILPDASGRGHFRLGTPQNGMFDLAVLANDGRTVLGQRVQLTTDNLFPLDLTTVASGAYIIRLVDTQAGAAFIARVVVR